MQTKKRIWALVCAAAMMLSAVPSISLAAGVSGELQAALDALVIPNKDDVRVNLSLPSVGENNASITWKSSDESVISTKEKENPGYIPAPAGIVTRGESDAKVTLTAKITLGRETAEKVFDLTVKALPKAQVSVMEDEVQGESTDKYLFYYFKGDYNGGEQIWLAQSDDGLKWKAMNGGEPIISSTMGTKGLRDPYILRSHDGDKFFLIATDLKISSTNWTNAQYSGSKSIMIWESTDLVNWSEQRMVEVSTRAEQGCTWAPEAAYDEETGQYVVFWSSKNTNNDIGRNGMQTVYYATTPDFYTFSEPEVFITHNSANPDEPINVIDTTIMYADDGKYYRLTKHEGISRIFIESAEHLLGPYSAVEGSNLYNDFSGVEGPEIYRLKDERYCAILDNFGGIGYYPVVTENISSGVFNKLDASEYDFGISPRHGAVLRISEEEYKAVAREYSFEAEPVEPDPEGSEPILIYNFDDETANDSSPNGYDATLYGNAKVVDNARMGKVLSLDGTTNTYLEIPQGALDGRNSITVSMDVLNNTSGNYFTFTMGRNNTYYFFTKMKDNGLKGAITTSSYQNEDIAESSDKSALNGQWKNATVTIDENAMRVYIDGTLAAENTSLSNKVSELGKNILAYIGKSFYSGDAYANMLVDNVHIYNRALSAEEIFEKYNLADGESKRYSIKIDADKKGADITQGMFGLFFEDINYAADGGLYSEVINNRSFEAYSKTDNKMIPDYGWSAWGESTQEYLSENPLNPNNTTYLRLTATASGGGVVNDCYGFTGENSELGENYASYSGFNAVKGKKFNASFYARGSYEGKILTEILDTEDNVIGSAFVQGITDEFKKYEFTLTAEESCKNARIRVSLETEGSVDLDMISVLPFDTFNGRDNGLRVDLVEKLAALRPGFIRFPGGCIVEGFDLSNRYQWKNTVGPLEQRVQNWNRWQSHNEYHSGNGMYGYCQTYGLGFYEYFLLCEDVGAKAVPVVNVGIGCQYQTGDYSSWEDLYDIYIPDALDLIEFANGAPDENWSEMILDMTDEASFNGNWANVRALMGHPASFEMEYIGIGNEQWNTSDNRFFERYEAFEEAIHEKYPEMKLIATSGPSSDGSDFSNAWEWLAEHNDDKDFAYTVDEHYYKTPDWFYEHINRYDGYDRNGFAVFAGEYASRWWSGYPRGNTLEASLSEAAYMTAMEKNSDIVKMASYAPLFARLGATQWSPDMIWFTSDSSYGSADYYVQQLFSRNSGTHNLLTKVSDKYEERSLSGKGYAGVGTWLTSAQFADYTVTDNETEEIISQGNWQLGNDIEKYDYSVSASVEQNGNSAENVKNSDSSSRWAGQGDGAYIVCDLGEEKTVGKIGVAAYYSAGKAYYYQLQISADGENYETVFDGTNGYDNADTVYTFTGNTTARYIKLVGKCNQGTSANDWNSYTYVEICGECIQTDEKVSLDPNGSWSVDESENVIQDNTSVSGAVLFSGDAIDTESYTITVKATKTGGNEGFLIPFAAADKDNYWFWNVGGWGNTMSAFQKHANASNDNTTVSDYCYHALETGREYELKLVYNNGVVQGFIDGKLINSCNIYPDLGPVYANAVYDDETGDIIVKAVNSSDSTKKIPVSINYSGSLTGYATEYLLAGEELSDKNTVNDMQKISVEKTEIDFVSDDFVYEMPKYSVAVLRIHTEGSKAVTAVEEINITTGSNFYPALPETVTVTLSDSTVEERSVKWILPNSGIYANEGSFKVYGRISGSEIDAVANITVEGDLAPDAISADTESLAKGEAAWVRFNPGVYGEYKGIVAIYNGDKLECVKLIEFEGSNYAVTLKVKNADGKKIKLMLWSDIEPVAAAQTIAPADASIMEVQESAKAEIEIIE